jgi:hypothetical protein
VTAASSQTCEIPVVLPESGYFLATVHILYVINISGNFLLTGRSQKVVFMIRLGRQAFLSAALCAVIAGPALAAGTHHVSEYSITLAGLPIARATFATDMESRGYTIAGNFRSAGIASILSDISAKFTVTGALQSDRLSADKYSLVYKTGKRTRTYDVTYKNGNVTDSVTVPPPRPRPASWVPVSEQDLRAVLDPISGLIFPADSPVCPRTVPIYDGESRMDLVLSKKGKDKFSTDGFKGEVIVCTVRYVPKSGFRKGRSDVEFLKKAEMEVWFAKADTVNVYAPVYARIPTRIGPVYVTAVKYGD